MVWIIGHYADRIENSDELLEDFLYSFLDEPAEVQLSLLTATVKLFLKKPAAGGAELVPKVLKWATEDVENPDVRDRGFMYWRLLSTDPTAARDVVLAEKPPISTEVDRMDRQLLDQLLLHGASLASIFHRQPQTFIRGTKERYLADSPALDELARRTASSHIYAKPERRGPYVAPPPPVAAQAAEGSNGEAAASRVVPPPLPSRASSSAVPLAAAATTNGHGDDDVRPPAAPSGGGARTAATTADDQDGQPDPYSMLADLEDDFIGGAGGGAGGYRSDAPVPTRGNEDRRFEDLLG